MLSANAFNLDQSKNMLLKLKKESCGEKKKMCIWVTFDLSELCKFYNLNNAIIRASVGVLTLYSIDTHFDE